MKRVQFEIAAPRQRIMILSTQLYFFRGVSSKGKLTFAVWWCHIPNPQTHDSASLHLGICLRNSTASSTAGPGTYSRYLRYFAWTLSVLTSLFSMVFEDDAFLVAPENSALWNCRAPLPLRVPARGRQYADIYCPHVLQRESPRWALPLLNLLAVLLLGRPPENIHRKWN